MDKEMRVRFAPSPTGPFHIGGARSALFNWLLAKKMGGKFVLRIEDTDRKRSTPESEENIKAALKWLGITWDEGVDVGGPYGPYHQMERLDIYKKYTDKLLAEGKAYYCYCTPEELEAERQADLKAGKMPKYSGKCRNLTPEQRAKYEAEGRKPSIRLKVPADQKIVVHDMVRGDVEFDSNGIGDFVIVKSDGIPTYNYAVVIDDYLMHITHVIRAEEHLSNTPRQLVVYDALGFEKPVFGHISLILGTDHTKMSKRHGATSVDAYRQKGYIPEGIDNFLALLGWAPEGEKEIFTMEEAAREFSMERVAKNPAVFDIKKLNWINGQHIHKMAPEAFFELAEPFMVQAGYMTGNETGEKLDWLKRVVATAQTQVEYGAQVPEKVAMYFSDDFDFENDEAKAVLSEPTAPMVLKALLAEFKALTEVNHDSVKGCFKKVQKGNKLKGQQVYMPFRVALTGNQHGPELAEMIPLMGVERVEKRVLSSLAKAGITL
ncbi:MAG: glutamate--tRNA ligase [Acidaminococcus sp.]|jgi:nondiscriminating glutamyl-tRNA synthetase|nr:glutamate--tRNA ligase [Acidaminococcus sp.]MCI2099723.1 glutamate--tRNA ligase [Acidaminococcus sp.]MCI2114008.1 glutamate--tRNA ligase [Acidaminococcus sp.]MCI2116116.1 glutamate--tRNA ligase [Acidaminococcus sp.]